MNEQHKHQNQPEKPTFSFRYKGEQEPLNAEIIEESTPTPTPNLPEKHFNEPVIDAQLLTEEDLQEHQEYVKKLNEKYAEQDAEDAEKRAKAKELAELAKQSTGAALGKLLIDDISGRSSTEKANRVKKPATRSPEEIQASYKTTQSTLETVATLLPEHSYIKYELDRATRENHRNESDFQQLDKVRRTLTMWREQEEKRGKDYAPENALKDYRDLYKANGKGAKEYDIDLTRRYRLLESLHRENPQTLEILMGKSIEETDQKKAA